MSNKSTGGPAFPVDQSALMQGMELRDYFAAKAMQAIISNADQEDISIDEVVSWVGAYAYEVADSMLKARKL